MTAYMTHAGHTSAQRSTAKINARQNCFTRSFPSQLAAQRQHPGRHAAAGGLGATCQAGSSLWRIAWVTLCLTCLPYMAMPASGSWVFAH